jgi:hypothetical protein
MGYNLSDPLDQARTGRVLPERDRSSHLVIVGGISHKNSSKVVCLERDQMVCALASDRCLERGSRPKKPCDYPADQFEHVSHEAEHRLIRGFAPAGRVYDRDAGCRLAKISSCGNGSVIQAYPSQATTDG